MAFDLQSENIAYLYTNSAATTWISEISVWGKLFNQGQSPVRVRGWWPEQTHLLLPPTYECAPVEADPSKGMNTARQTSRFRSILRDIAQKWD
jgi:hypothetical protein